MFLINIDPMGYHQILNSLQLIVSEVFILFALWVTSVVMVSTQFMIIVLKIKRKQKLMVVLFLLAAALILVSWILSIYMAVKISNWEIEDFSKSNVTVYHISISTLSFLFLLIGEFLLFKQILTLKDNSDQSTKKKKQYLILSLSVIWFSIGCLLGIVVIAIYRDLNPWKMVYLAYFASSFYVASTLLIFRKVNKKKSGSTNTMTENSIKK